ncbi:MAG: hypothetical protein ACI83B_003864 [Sediminicola sp.]
MFLIFFFYSRDYYFYPAKAKPDELTKHPWLQLIKLEQPGIKRAVSILIIEVKNQIVESRGNLYLNSYYVFPQVT